MSILGEVQDLQSIHALLVSKSIVTLEKLFERMLYWTTIA